MIYQEPWRTNKRKRGNGNHPPAMDLQYAQVCWGPRCYDNNHHKTSEQHVELGVSRSKRDFKDLSNIQEWFDQHEPFNLNEERLRSLSSGLTATDGDGVNCHNNPETTRQCEASIKRSEQVRSLDHLYPGIKVDKQKVHINPTLGL